MKIVNGFDLMKYATDHHYMRPAFNTTNLEMTFAIAKGLNNAGLPGYIQISSNNLRLSNPEVITYLTREALKNVDVPIGLHLDHGKSYEDVKRTFNDYRINLCVFKPARPEDIDDIVVSVMKIKNKSTKTMPESRLKLVPILYANPSYEKFWKTIDAEMTEGAVAGSDKNSQTCFMSFK